MRKKIFLIALAILIALSFSIVFFILTTITSSPKPMIIVAPKTTVTENNSYVNSLIIDMSQKEKLTLTYLDQDHNKRSIDININNKKKLEEMLQQAINWAGNGQKLNVLIQSNKEASYKTFQTVIETLKAKKIYKYKLITTPDRR